MHRNWYFPFPSGNVELLLNEQVKNLQKQKIFSPNR